jgi:hypothetical protein
MRHAALIQPKPEQPPQLIGLGETWADAMAGARAWFGTEMDRTSSKDWPRLFALQEQLTVYTEDEFAAKTGIALDDWLAHVSATGIAPTMTSAMPVEDAWIPLPAPRSNSNSLPMMVYYTIGALIFISVMAGVRYGGTRILQREIDAITNSNNAFDIGSGPAYDSAIATVDPDDFWGDLYGPLDTGPSIGGVTGP